MLNDQRCVASRGVRHALQAAFLLEAHNCHGICVAQKFPFAISGSPIQRSSLWSPHAGGGDADIETQFVR